jgi:hypothetical protein
MWHLYLDESGDLGFDFVNKKPSRYFTISILVVKSQEHNRTLINSVKHTLKRKLTKELKNHTIELKGAKTSLAIKKYFFQQIHTLPFEVYCLTFDKRILFDRLVKDKERIYNYIARRVLDKIPFEKASSAIELIVDKSKNMVEIAEFNSYILRHLQGRITPKVPLQIFHRRSHENYGLQAVDIISWSVFRKYEKQDKEASIFFKEKIRYDEMYSP